MRATNLLVVLACLSFVSSCGRDEEPADESQPSLNLNATYAEKVSPIVSEKCTPCHAVGKKHNPYAESKDALLNNREAVRARISRSSSEPGIMPPVKSGKSLSEEEKQIILDFLNQ